MPTIYLGVLPAEQPSAVLAATLVSATSLRKVYDGFLPVTRRMLSYQRALALLTA